MTIRLEGLTPRQAILADLIWSCQTKKDIDYLISMMPDQELKEEAATLVNLMIVETIDECCDGTDRMDEANEVLDKFRL